MSPQISERAHVKHYNIDLSSWYDMGSGLH